jgi:Holliday junction resolvasome RuvABC endonuclease subunit
MVARAVITLVLVTVLIGYTLIAAHNVQQQLIAHGIIKKTETQNPLANVLEGIRRTASIAGPALAIATITAAATLTVIRSRRILGIIPFKDVRRHLMILG